MIKRICLVITFFFLSYSTSSFAAYYVATSLSYDSFSLQDTTWIGFTPRLSLGYGTVFNDWISFSAEIFGNAKPITKHSHEDKAGDKDTDADDTADTIKVRPSWSYGLAIYPAFELDSLLSLFFHLGLIETKFSAFNKKRLGGQVGVGLASNIAPGWCLRLEYVYARYKSVQGLGKPSSGSYSLGLVYQFM